MAVTNAKLEGDKALQRQLRAFKPAVQRRIMRSPIRSAASIVNKAAKRNAPVESGALRKSIGVRVKTYPNGVVVGVVGPRRGMVFDVSVKGPGGDWTVTEKRTPAKYAHLVEFGTQAHPLGKGDSAGEHPGAVVKPFMRPAWDESKTAAKRVIATKGLENIQKELEKLRDKRAGRRR